MRPALGMVTGGTPHGQIQLSLWSCSGSGCTKLQQPEKPAKWSANALMRPTFSTCILRHACLNIPIRWFSTTFPAINHHSQLLTISNDHKLSFINQPWPSFALASQLQLADASPVFRPSGAPQALRNWLLNGVAGPDGKCRNDSMSFVDVRDCAAQHVAAMEKEGRFMSFLVETNAVVYWVQYVQWCKDWCKDWIINQWLVMIVSG